MPSRGGRSSPRRPSVPCSTSHERTPGALVAWTGERNGLRSLRKHLGWYLTGYPVGGVIRRQASQVSSLAELDHLFAGLDRTLELTPNALRVPRGHTQGPRPVQLPERWLHLVDDPTPPAGAELAISGG